MEMKEAEPFTEEELQRLQVQKLSKPPLHRSIPSLQNERVTGGQSSSSSSSSSIYSASLAVNGHQNSDHQQSVPINHITGMAIHSPNSHPASLLSGPSSPAPSAMPDSYNNSNNKKRERDGAEGLASLSSVEGEHQKQKQKQC
jgi:hypothetical protein